MTTTRLRQRDEEEESDCNGASRRQKLFEDETVEGYEVEGDNGVKHDPYYLANFRDCISYVKSSLEGHVITSDIDQIALLESFENIDELCQQLLVRLYLRQHKWLRVDKISYPRIASDLKPLVKELVSKGLLEDGSILTNTDEILSLLQAPELKLLCKQLHQPPSIISLPKQQCMSSLIEHYKKQRPLLPHLSPLNALNKRAKLLLGDCIRVTVQCVEVFDRIILLYSLLTSGESNEEITPQSIIYHMLQVNTGQVTYPIYQCNITRPLFICRQDFERFYMAYKHQQRLASLIANKSVTVSILTDIVDTISTLLLSQVQEHTCSVSSNGSPMKDLSNTCTCTSPVIDSTGDSIDDGSITVSDSKDNTIVTLTRTRRRKRQDVVIASTRQEDKKRQCTNVVIDLTKDIEEGEEKEEKQKLAEKKEKEGEKKQKLAEKKEKVFYEPLLSVLYSCTCCPTSQFWSRFCAGSICTRILSSCVECWEKLRNYNEANRLLKLCLEQTMFGCHRRGNWWERLALNLDSHFKDPIQSLQCIKTALDDVYLHDSIRYTLCQRAYKLCSLLEKKRVACNYKMADFLPPIIIEHKEITLTGIQQPSTCLFIITHHGEEEREKGDTEEGGEKRDKNPTTNSSSLSSVEGFAIHHYTSIEKWPNALHAEGSSLLCVFVCLMWDVIFTETVSDVFRGPYQMGPLDFGRRGFYLSRIELINERLKWIRESPIEELLTEITKCWSAHFGVAVCGVNWDLFPNGLEDLTGLTLSLGNQVLAQICELFAQDCYGSRSGVPDLILWNKETKTCKFVEVKGPGDRLSSKQVLWLSRLAEWGCQVEVCRVQAIRS